MVGLPTNVQEQFGRFEIRVRERELRIDGRPVALGSRAFDLLAALVARRDRVVPKDELIDLVWPGMVVEDNNLQVQVSALRKVLGPQAIATVPGRGYRFAVAAASAGPSIETDGSRNPAHRAGARPSRLLVVDDNRLNRLLLCRSLELMGHEVDWAVNGRDALETLRSERVDLLLLDLQMPELDGFALLELRAADPVLREIPVIVTSALEGTAHVARCIELGADDYLQKPPNPMLLEARVRASLERKHLRDRERELLARLSPVGAKGGGHHVEATVLHAALDDIEELEETPARTLALLGDWCTLMLDAIEGHGGVVTRLAGDAVGAVFGADGAMAPEQASWSSLQAAREMIELAEQFDRERMAAGRKTVAMRIGIASGPAFVGQAGTRRRAAYVCVGATPRRALQLHGLAARTKAALLMDEATAAWIGGRVETNVVREAGAGSNETVTAYALKGS